MFSKWVKYKWGTYYRHIVLEKLISICAYALPPTTETGLLIDT